jgi:hypothetical protein
MAFAKKDKSSLRTEVKSWTRLFTHAYKSEGILQACSIYIWSCLVRPALPLDFMEKKSNKSLKKMMMMMMKTFKRNEET